MRAACDLAQHHEADRLVQAKQQGDREQQRQHAAENEDRVPAVMRDQRRSDRTADDAAEREGGIHHAHQGRARPVGRIFGHHGDSVRQRAAEPDADQHAENEQRAEVVGIDRQQREHAEDRGRHDHAHPAAVAVGIPAEEHRSGCGADVVRGKNRSEGFARQLPRRADHGRHVGNRQDVKTVEERHAGAQQRRPQ